MGTFIPFPKAATEQSIPARFEQLVRQYPDRLAVKTCTHELTYAALNMRANRVAHALLAQRQAAQEPVAVLLAHDAPGIAAMLGILKAGKLCVPLDVSAPQRRLQHILTDVQATLLVTDAMHEAVAREAAPAACAVVPVETLEAPGAEANPDLPLAHERLAHLIYTSGSTGQPKGVVKSHRQVLHEVRRLTNAFHICAHDRHILLRSLSSNGAIQDIYSALLNGAAVFPLSLEHAGFAGLAAWLQEHDITIFRSAATVFRHFMSALPETAIFPRLRLIQTGGEPVTRQDLVFYKTHCAPDCLFVNCLGLTETGPVCMYVLDQASPLPDNLVPVGYAIEDMEVLVLDDTGKAVAQGDVGEIFVQSDALAAGYWRNPTLTQATFLPDPSGGEVRRYRTGDLGRLLPDGCLEHLGRKDAQVKIRGNRVNIAEVEQALLNLEYVKEAVVLGEEGPFGAPRLVAYVVSTTPTAPTISTVQHALRSTLPAYMVPSAVVVLEALPRTATGKIDRQALPTPDTGRSILARPVTPPRTPLETELVRLWAAVLHLEQVGVEEHFLDLGGDSLLASQLIARVIQTLGGDLPVRALLEAPTVAAMAMVIVQHQAEQMGPQDLTRLLAEIEGSSDLRLPL
jgi:amino acid adenylation domain-containing protein